MKKYPVIIIKKYGRCLRATILPFLLFFNFVAFAQTGSSYSVSVVDEKNLPLPGVNVFTDDQSFFGVTDENGKINLTNISYSTIVNFSYIGYGSLRLPFFKIRQQGGLVKMSQAFGLLPTVVVLGRRDEKPQEIPYQTATIDKKEIAFFNSQTTADALSLNENVFVQKSQMGGGSINIRGFEANKVLLVLDGVRMNNITYRKGHLQDAIKVDNGMLERIEVIYGPGSLDYGSDALGGVVHFRTREPKLLDSDENPNNGYRIATNAYTRFSSANLEKTVHLDFNYALRKWGFLTSLSFSDFGDLRAGANRPEQFPQFGVRREYAAREDFDLILENQDTNVQKPTAYAQFDLLQKVKFQPDRNRSFVLNIQYSRSTNIPRYDFLNEYDARGRLNFADWYYGPQQRILTSLKYQTFKSTALYNRAVVIASLQKLDEDRYERRLNKPLEFTYDDVWALSLTSDFDKNLAEGLLLTYGIDLNRDILFSTAGKEDLESGKTFVGQKFARYPSGGSNMTNLAGYATLRWQTQDSVLGVFGGMRYTWTRLFTIYDRGFEEPVRWPESFYDDGFELTAAAPTWSIGVTWRSSDKWQAKAMASSAFHAPNVDDMAKVRVRNNKMLVPNPDLGPEKSRSYEISLGKEFGSVRRKEGVNAFLEASIYGTVVDDLIITENFQLPDGSTTYETDGNIYIIQGTVNRQKAYIAGGSGNLLLTFGKNWEFRSMAGYSYGRVVPDDLKNEGLFNWLGDTMTYEPLDHIPPAFGKSSLAYQNDWMRLSFMVRWNAWKWWKDYRLNTEDNEDNAVEGYGTYAWTTYNLYTTFNITKKLSIDAAVENILDFHYRPFMSGVSAPGRNFIVTLRGSF